MATHQITPDLLTLERVDEILHKGMKLELSQESKARIVKCREYLDNKMTTQKEPIYGVTTGFGSLCNISISKEQLSQLQKNLVMSHACGVGEQVPHEIVKIMLMNKIQSLSTRLFGCFGRPCSFGSSLFAAFGFGSCRLQRRKN